MSNTSINLATDQKFLDAFDDVVSVRFLSKSGHVGISVYDPYDQRELAAYATFTVAQLLEIAHQATQLECGR